MQIGEVIRKYRKEKNLTQEEMANRLGVTAPAVNKWENGNSLPDITLLAPIARLLEISLDTLLSFQEELTEEEIGNYIRELDDRLKNGPYEEAFRWARGVMETYPNCELLIFQVAVLLNARLLVESISDAEEYEAYIEKCFIRTLESRDENVRYRAAGTLCGFYTRKKQYDQAEKYLTYLSEKDPERKRRQAELYYLSGRKEEAYKAYEKMLFEGCNMLSMVFQGLKHLALQEDDGQKAHLMAEKQRELSRLFEMGKYQELSWGLDLATLEKDAEAVIELTKGLIDNVAEIGAFSKSRLFEHMHFHEVKPEFLESLKKQIIEGCRDEETYGWLMSDERWRELIQ